MKRAFKMKSKGFFLIFKGLAMKQIMQIFSEDESPTLRSSRSISIEQMLSSLWEKPLFDFIKRTT